VSQVEAGGRRRTSSTQYQGQGNGSQQFIGEEDYSQEEAIRNRRRTMSNQYSGEDDMDNSPNSNVDMHGKMSQPNIMFGEGLGHLNASLFGKKEEVDSEKHKHEVFEEAKKRLLQLIMFVTFVTIFTISSVYLRHLHNGEAYFLKARVEDLLCRPATHSGFNNGHTGIKTVHHLYSWMVNTLWRNMYTSYSFDGDQCFPNNRQGFLMGEKNKTTAYMRCADLILAVIFLFVLPGLLSFTLIQT
jgi:hypothetical protein